MLVHSVTNNGSTTLSANSQGQLDTLLGRPNSAPGPESVDPQYGTNLGGSTDGYRTAKHAFLPCLLTEASNSTCMRKEDDKIRRRNAYLSWAL